MGNQPSKTPPPGSAREPAPGHAHSLSTNSQPASSSRQHQARHLPRRSHTAAAPAGSTASSSPHSPPFSAAGSPDRHLPPYHPSRHHRRAGSAAMGNSQSAEAAAPPSGASSRSSRRHEPSHGHSSSSVTTATTAATSPWDVHSSPMQVPAGGEHRAAQEAAAAAARAAGQDMNPPAAGSPLQAEEYAPASNLNFPPRLPLPIQEEVYTPGSPIISPHDLSAALNEDGEPERGLAPNRTSLLSHTTAEEDDDGDFESGADNKGRTVPTAVEWSGNAEKVYVTGSFANWGRKFRMDRSPNDPQMLATKLDLLPGTHHVKFIVDGDMKLSTELPTAVDYTNVLVNYIEVSADDIPKEPQPKEQPPDDIHPPLVVPPGVEKTDWQSKADESTAEKQLDEKKYLPRSSAHYSDVMPQYLPDMDREEASNRFRRSMNNVADIPPPPSLPLFLGKSILNGTTPMKDDSSVLNMPNHTVLNHLATSSIKNDVLATSLTTRYRRKYVTTITYRPTREDD